MILVGIGFERVFMEETNIDYSTFYLKRMLVAA